MHHFIVLLAAPAPVKPAAEETVKVIAAPVPVVVDPKAEIEKKIRASKKKLRQIEELEVLLYSVLLNFLS